jgi:PAS domain S-box-containing protein
MVERTYRSLFKNVEEAIIVENRNQEIIDSNPAAVEIFGYSREELLQMKSTELKALESIRESSQEIYNKPSTQNNAVFRTHAKSSSGRVFPIEVTLVSINQNEEVFFLSIIRDLSNLESTKAQNGWDETRVEQVAKQLKYESLFKVSLQGIILIEGPPNQISLANPAAADILGYEEEELKSLAPEELESSIHWTDRNEILSQMGSLLRGETDSVRTQGRFIRKDGEIVWLDLSMATLGSSGSLSILATFLDITEWREAMADIVATNQDLDLYGSLLRHDFRNDLLVISGNTEIIGMLASHNEEIKQYVEANLAGVDRMLQLLDLFGSPEKSRSRQIAPILEDIWSYATRTYVELECKLHIDPDVFMTTVVSGRLLPMVFNNLIRNTVKYAGPNPEMRIEASRTNNHIKIRVADDGPGIPQEIKEELFERGTTTEGTGLGLYLSRRVIEAYGGTIELADQKNENEGAVFVIKLRIKEE